MTLNRHRPPGLEEEPAPATRAGAGSALSPALGLLLFLAGATLLFGVLAARTAGFRELAAARIESWTQTKVTIGGSRIGWPYDLVLTDLALPVDPEAEAAGGLPAASGARVAAVRVSWRPFRGLEIRMERPAARVERQPDGSWQPEALALLGDIRNAADVASWLAPVRGRATIRIAGGALDAAGPDGTVLRRMEAIDLAATPVTLPGRAGMHLALRAGRVTAGPIERRNLAQEWLALDGTNTLEIAFDADGEGAGAGRDFWKGFQP